MTKLEIEMNTTNDKPFEQWPKALQLAHVACDDETAEMLRSQHAEIQSLTAELDAARRALADIHEACQHSPYRGDGSWDVPLAALINHHARLLPATEARHV